MPASRAAGTGEPPDSRPLPTAPAARPHTRPRGGGPGHVHDQHPGPHSTGSDPGGRTPGGGGSWGGAGGHWSLMNCLRRERGPLPWRSLLLASLCPKPSSWKGDRVGGEGDQGGAPLTCRRQWSGPNGPLPAPPPRPPSLSASGVSLGAPPRRQKQSRTRGLKTGGTGSRPQERGPPARGPAPPVHRDPESGGVLHCGAGRGSGQGSGGLPAFRRGAGPHGRRPEPVP